MVSTVEAVGLCFGDSFVVYGSSYMQNINAHPKGNRSKDNSNVAIRIR